MANSVTSVVTTLKTLLPFVTWTRSGPVLFHDYFSKIRTRPSRELSRAGAGKAPLPPPDLCAGQLMPANIHVIDPAGSRPSLRSGRSLAPHALRVACPCAVPPCHDGHDSHDGRDSQAIQPTCGGCTRTGSLALRCLGQRRLDTANTEAHPWGCAYIQEVSGLRPDTFPDAVWS